MSAKLSSKKKILIAASLLGIFLIGTIVSIVLVLAASAQGVTSNITVSYNAEGVAAKVSANYAIVPLDTSATVTKTAMTTSGGGQEITFNLSTAQSRETIAPDAVIELDTQKQTVVFEYVFENLAETAFSLSLTQRPTGINMTEAFYVSGLALDPSDYASAITNTSLATQAVTYIGQKVYVYILASVTNENRIASYNGAYVWELKAKDATINVTLNNGGNADGIETLPVISTSTVSGIMMPAISDIPEKENYEFKGYYTAVDGTGTQYYNEKGSPLEVAVTSDMTLYAHYVQTAEVGSPTGYFIYDESDDTKIIGLTAEGAEATKVVIPSTVTTIANGAFAGNTAIEEITFEGAELETEAYANSTPVLKTIEATAFENCTSLKKIVIPSSVTTFGTTPLAGCTALEEIEFPYILGNGTYLAPKSTFSKLFGTATTDIPGTLTTVVINGGTSIGSYAFYGCSGLTSITIPEGVTYIGGYVFSGCSSLNSINILEGVKSIGNYTFSGCSSLTNITIPESVTSIGSSAFQGCSGLISINIPEGVRGIGDSAFYNCSSLTSVRIPEGVTSIGSSAFQCCSSLTNITIPESVTSIGSSAFQGCSGLTSINIPEGVTSVGQYTFYGCSSLTSITIPSGVTSIGSSALGSCSSLTSISIPEGVTSIGSSVFEYCSSLTSINIPEGVTSIGNYTFDGCKSITSITIPSGVTSIGIEAFNNCSSLTSITIPSSVTSIGSNAFYYCSKLTEVNITSLEAWCNITFGNGTANPIYYAKGLTLNGALLTEIEIPETITKINAYAFYGCSSLTSVSIPSSVTSIVSDAFSGCSSIKEVNITSLEAWCNITFGNNSANPTYYAKGLTLNGTLLTEIEIPETLTEINAYTFYNCSGITSITIPEGVTSIGNSAFYGCSKLTSINIPEGVTSIGGSAFSGCSSLTSINIPEGVISIENYTFSGCSSLTSISIPEGVKSIGSQVFYNCSGLTSVTFAENSKITSIGSYAFRNCSGLTSITIPESVTSIGNYAFYGCSKLISITIPEGVTSIGTYTFFSCSSLTSINIPEGVTSIGSNAFSGSSSLTSITIPSRVTSIGSQALSGCSGLNSIVVDEENSVYNSGNGSNCIIVTATNTLILGCNTTTIPSSVTSIGQSAFSSCGSLTSLTIPEGVTSIGSAAFSGCTALTEINWNAKKLSSALSTSSNLFSNAGINGSGITVNIGEEVEEIPAYLFYISTSSRPNITSVTIAENSRLTSIGERAFQGCSGLTSITIPESVTSIGNSAFSGCTALTEINWNAKKLSSALTYSSNIFYKAGTNGITVNIGEEVEEIPAYLFYAGYSPNITSVVLPEGSTWIRSTTKGTTTGTPVTESAAKIATNLKNSWSTYYLIRTDK